MNLWMDFAALLCTVPRQQAFYSLKSPTAQARGREPVAGGLAWVLAKQARLAWLVLEDHWLIMRQVILTPGEDG
jgi:hypothetical protein